MKDFYIYHRPETNQDEKVTPERWCWEAHYNDGTVLRQFNDDDNSFHQLREIQQEKLGFFRMINYETGKYHDILWNPARKLIHFYNRNILDNQTRFVTLYCFGYETFVNGVGHKVILVIDPEDNIAVTEDIGNIQVL